MNPESIDAVLRGRYVPFSALEKGERFRFLLSGSTEVHTKVSATRYVDPRGRRWATGTLVGVVREPKEASNAV